MHRATKLFRIFGIDVKLHYTWWFVFIFIAWSLASSFFPHYFPEYTTTEYWIMGIVASALLFVSVLLHELAHSLVAKAKNIKVDSITLFFFGGVASISKEDMKPSSEFFMAIAGPLFSIFLGGVFYVLHILDINGMWTAITFYLYQLNFILAAFNLVPGYPLDGGRALRAILYAYYKDITKPTRIAAGLGKLFAGFLIVLGLVSLFSGIGTGLWFVLLGGFLYFIANISYQQVVIKSILDKITVQELSTKPTIVSPTLKFVDFMKKYGNSGKTTFIVKGKSFSGVLDINRIQRISPKMKDLVTVQQLSVSLHKIKTVSLKDTAYTAFKLITTQNIEILPVMHKKSLVSVITRQSLTNRLMWETKFHTIRKRKA